MRRLNAVDGRKQHVSDDLIWAKVVLAFSVGFRRYEEFLQRQFALALRALQPDCRSIGDKNGRDGGRADKLCWPLIAKNGVVAVLAHCYQLLAVLIFR